MQRIKPFIIPGVIILAILMLAAWIMARSLLDERAAPKGPMLEVVIPRGASIRDAAVILAGKGLIKDSGHLVLAARLLRVKGIKAGEYGIHAWMSNRRILNMLGRGRVLMHQVVIPEGFSMERIIARLAAKRLVDAEKAAHLCRDRAFLKSLGIEAESLEGYLFPATYRFSRGQGAEKILSSLARRFKRAWAKVKSRAGGMGLTRHQAVTLASIIEKEVRVKAEMPLVSAVYHNRLKRGMRLQADPTVIYGIKDFNGNLTKRDLAKDTPYNTYTRGGLPPGPIASPGEDALLAALSPAKVDYLYFVARGDGSHQFSRSYRAHARAVRRLQKRRR